MKKQEKIFLLSLFLFSAVLFCGICLVQNQNKHSMIRISINGTEYGTYSLSEDQEIAIGDTNICEISNETAKMTQANCPDKLCLQQHAIDHNGGMIVCLPNKILIEGVS